MKVKTTYGEIGRVIEIIENVARVQIGCEIRHIHITKIFAI